MKFVTSLILIIFFYFVNFANANEFYIKALKEAALSNGFKKPEEINSLFDKEKSEFSHSIEAVKKLWEAASKIDPDLAK